MRLWKVKEIVIYTLVVIILIVTDDLGNQILQGSVLGMFDSIVAFVTLVLILIGGKQIMVQLFD